MPLFLAYILLNPGKNLAWYSYFTSIIFLPSNSMLIIETFVSVLFIYFLLKGIDQQFYGLFCFVIQMPSTFLYLRSF